ncbi:DinB family protein [Brevibacillus sp. AG]|uniref:DinB family protein n=1 Tax=Brevibacillus sp. AG TaxID=3020891 RepID=UPI00085352C0|nr:DinB family protein [Brevibacillus sp. AG]MDC0759164.1 DinB family protein [Brevibacillus sp. AG]
MYFRKPQSGDYPAQFETYIKIAPEGNLNELLCAQEEEILACFRSCGEEQSMFRYQEDKWSGKEVLGHIMDTERIMCYRLLCASRGDKTPLPRHQDMYVSLTNFDRRPLVDLLEEYRTVRSSTRALLKGLTEEELSRSGVIIQDKTTATALVYFILGHAAHHLHVFRERYMSHLSQI